MALFTYPIRYDGGDASAHRIEVRHLAESLQGISRLLEVAGHFAATGDVRSQSASDVVRVYIEAPEANCFDVSVMFDWARQVQFFQGGFGEIVALVVAYVIGKRSRASSDEMNHLARLAEKALQQNGDLTKEMLRTQLEALDRIAESMARATRQSVEPIGSSCDTIRFGEGDQATTVDAEKKRLIDEVVTDVLDESTHTIKLSELDVTRGTCKFAFASDGAGTSRRNGVIGDPSVSMPGNPYLEAFASQEAISVRGKIVVKDGSFHQLHISDLLTAYPD